MRLLSIQSHVVSGYVGNRAATFPLQLLGYDVDVINTVQFSNHTGYGHTNGHKTTPEQLQAVFDGLRTNHLDAYDKVLTGYIPGADALSVVKRRIEWIQHGVYLLDPVMGDIGTGLYVAPDVIPVYQSMLSLAHIITPNHFETELLADCKIKTLDDVWAALRTLHRSTTNVVLSSISLPLEFLKDLPLPPPPTSYTNLLPASTPWYSAIDRQPKEVLVCFASGSDGISIYALPTIEGYFSGVGDLFSALTLAHYDGSIHHAVARALMTVQKVLLLTHIGTSGTATPRPLHTPAHEKTSFDLSQPAKMRARELRIVTAQDVILSSEEWPGHIIHDALHSL